MNKIEEAHFAWKVWNLLVDLEPFLWERYEKQFLTFILEKHNTELTTDLQPLPDDIPAAEL
jgi:hypothetical protein